MSIKHHILILAFCLTVILGGIMSVTGQSKNSDLTWSEVKLSQEKERVLLESTQKNTLDELMSRQNDELYRIRSSETVSTQELANLVKSHKEERLQIIKQFSEERTKLAQIHSEERKAYLQSRNSK